MPVSVYRIRNSEESAEWPGFSVANWANVGHILVVVVSDAIYCKLDARQSLMLARPTTPLAARVQRPTCTTSFTVHYCYSANVTETQKLSSVDKPTKIGCYGYVPCGVGKLILD